MNIIITMMEKTIITINRRELYENYNIEVSKKISEDLDIGQTTLKKAQYIYNNASEEMIKQLDEGQLSINKAYNDLKGKLKQEQRGGNFPWLKEGNNWRM